MLHRSEIQTCNILGFRRRYPRPQTPSIPVRFLRNWNIRYQGQCHTFQGFSLGLAYTRQTPESNSKIRLPISYLEISGSPSELLCMRLFNTYTLPEPLHLSRFNSTQHFATNNTSGITHGHHLKTKIGRLHRCNLPIGISNCANFERALVVLDYLLRTS